ncbi:MAG: hypothetical protein K6G03_01980 [Lachnospiraceae bacterium]|nr:hypothetical protein [Lachnospiraceae bacterium]
MNKEEFENPESKAAAYAKATRTGAELADTVKENDLDQYVDTSILEKDISKMSYQEKMQYLRDMEFEHEALRNHWTGEEKVNKRAEFDRQKQEDRNMIKNELDIILNNGENLSEFEERQTETYMEEHPEEVDLMIGMVRMINAGETDPRNIDKYMN